jgi:hypothetical protein
MAYIMAPWVSVLCSARYEFHKVGCHLWLTAPNPRGTRNQPHEALWKSGLISADSGLQLNLEIALSGVSAKVKPLNPPFSPG